MSSGHVVFRCVAAVFVALLAFCTISIWVGVPVAEEVSEGADDAHGNDAADWERQLEQLRAVPYVGYTKDPVAKRDTGVVIYDIERVCDGYNFHCGRTSGEAFLLDMNGRVAHRWIHSTPKEFAKDHAAMLENGDLMVLVNNTELLLLDWNSELIWTKELEVHHDIAPAPDGSFYVLSWEQKKHRELRVRFPAVVHLNAVGEELDRWSAHSRLADMMEVLDTRSFLDTILDSIASEPSPEALPPKIKAARKPGRFPYDYFHMNSIMVLPATPLGERDPRFQEGNLLTCFRNVNQIAVLEKDTYRFLWAWGEGELDWPHHPTMLENGHILIFDNGFKRKYSRVVELDPLAEEIIWEYVAEPNEDFFSSLGGSSQRLPNGNTLICESDQGRVFEVTREGDMVWMWLNPTTRRGRRENLYRVLRIPAAQVKPLLEMGARLKQ